MVQLILVFPLLVAFPIKMMGFDPLDYSTTGIFHSATFLVPMLIIAIALGWWWNPKKFLTNAAIFYTPFLQFSIPPSLPMARASSPVWSVLWVIGCSASGAARQPALVLLRSGSNPDL